MTAWTETDEAAAFIATADSRGTDKRIMQAIAFFAENAIEAEAFWNGDFAGKCDYLSIWENVTNNGFLDGYQMFWGDAGSLNSLTFDRRKPKFFGV
jgi:hypothetical protein